MLTDEIRKFFQSLTNSKEVIELAVEIQQSLEKGNTAIESKELLEDDLISKDGKSGYIVQTDEMAGFRRFYNLEKNIQQDFTNNDEIEIDQHNLNQVLIEVCQILNLNQPNKDEINQDKQWQASLNFLHHKRYIVSGGPGTGKTTTTVRMLLLYANLYPENTIALAAPTGKAANRMMQSINSLLPNQYQYTAQTLHRLLGYNHQKNTLKYNKDNTLPYDLVIIDESSMLDTTMANALIEALKPSAQLLFIGDKNQLPAVEAGHVFADLCEISKHNSIELEKNYRFAADSKIANLCNCLIKQDMSGFKKVNAYSNPPSLQEKQVILKKWYQSIGNDSAVLLSPIKQGKNSVDELNKMAMQILYKNNKLNENMPIIVHHNDYTLGIFNGDVGTLQNIDGEWQVPFQISGKTKHVKLDAIKQWQVAHAITIHKSQGSEYDHVLVALPDDLDLEILTNQLLYTAISRAKKSITIWSSDKIIEKIINTNATRKTFLN